MGRFHHARRGAAGPTTRWREICLNCVFRPDREREEDSVLPDDDEVGRTFAIRLPPTRQAPGAARRSLGAELTGRGATSEDVDLAKIVVTELVGNAVLHGSGSEDVEVCASWDDRRLRIEVTDAGGSRPKWLAGANDLDADDGRGLQIVEALTENWGASAGPGVLTVWAVLATAAHAPPTDET